jgi:hypothetical protein
MGTEPVGIDTAWDYQDQAQIAAILKVCVHMRLCGVRNSRTARARSCGWCLCLIDLSLVPDESARRRPQQVVPNTTPTHLSCALGMHATDLQLLGRGVPPPVAHAG